MATKHTMKQGDLRPPLVLTVLDGTTAVDLTNAVSVLLYMRAPDGTLVVDGEAMVKLTQSGSTLGKVSRDWQPTETDVVGDHDAEIKVLWPDDEPQRFPASGYVTVQITPKLG